MTRHPLYKRLGGPQGRSGQVQKIVKETELSLKSDKNNGYLTYRHVYDIAEFFLEWEMFQKKVI